MDESFRYIIFTIIVCGINVYMVSFMRTHHTHAHYIICCHLAIIYLDNYVDELTEYRENMEVGRVCGSGRPRTAYNVSPKIVDGVTQMAK